MILNAFQSQRYNPKCYSKQLKDVMGVDISVTLHPYDLSLT